MSGESYAVSTTHTEGSQFVDAAVSVRPFTSAANEHAAGLSAASAFTVVVTTTEVNTPAVRFRVAELIVDPAGMSTAVNRMYDR